MRNMRGPTPSEITLFQVWDLLDRERVLHGERAAAQLARAALRAVETKGAQSPRRRKDAGEP